MVYFMHKSMLIPINEVEFRGRGTVQVMERIEPANIQVIDPCQRDPLRKQHHDHLIQRHIRSPRQTRRQ